MPKVAIDYSKTKMYKLKHKDDDDDENIYVGHTTNWIQRKANHKTCCNNENSKEYNLKKNKYIRENGGWDEWEMVWIEDYPCNHKREAEAREEYLRCDNNAKLNSNRAIITPTEYIEKKKEYYKNNENKIKEQTKNYNKNNDEKYKGKITC